MLKIENAKLELGERVIFENFDINITHGELVCVTGSSGCGKTSLIRSILGFLPLSHGNIYIDGKQVSHNNIDEIRKKMAYLPQDINLPYEWVEDMIKATFELKCNRNIHFSKKVLFDIWNDLALSPDLFNLRVSQLSGGQKQRVMLSIFAFIKKPLFLIDEPTSALDADSSHRVLKLLKKMSTDGCTILAVSHSKEFMHNCDRIIYM